MPNKPISDIRLFMSRVPNEDGQSLPAPCGSRHISVALRRIAMKLREGGFSLGDFDHLYVNLTPCTPEGTVQMAARSVHRETAWLRYVDAGVTEAQLADEPALDALALGLAEKCLLLFAPDESRQRLVRSAVREATEQGADMLMRFKEKRVPGLTATVFLRLLDSGLYLPLLCVSDADGQEKLRADLPPCMELHALGEIRLTRRTVTILPRRNAFTVGMEPLHFQITP